MAHSLSAQKRNRQNITRQARNQARKTQLKPHIKEYDSALAGGDLQTAQQQLDSTCKKLDQVAAKGTIHKNTAARKKARLAKKLNALKAAKPQAGAK